MECVLGGIARLLPNTHLLVSAGVGRLTIMLRSRTLAALVLVCILALSQDGLVQPASAVVVGLSQDNKDGAIDVRINHEEGSGSPYQVTHVQADAEGTKREWPELLGIDVETAVSAIRTERPDLNVQVLDQDAMYTQDYVTERVRIFEDAESRTVARVPRVG
ncbi:hypothetical protein PPROV_000395700 [Pycnococcus provasolii]|uniref:Subtilisin inhibitor domain-containing protein n=1 Tax=Pycnococcus provasolii TaxID=41880 RepID=A0A830HDV0_9CHLO|nr:hypothetical protein PPROV_000395700 [Pycnococcus provasolii]